MSFKFEIDGKSHTSEISVDEIIEARIQDKPTPWYLKKTAKKDGVQDLCDLTGLSLTQTIQMRESAEWIEAVNGRTDLTDSQRKKLLEVRKPSKQAKTPEERVVKALKPISELISGLGTDEVESYGGIIESVWATTTEPIKAKIEAAKKERIEREKRQAEAAAAKAQLDKLISENPELAALKAKVDALEADAS